MGKRSPSHIPPTTILLASASPRRRDLLLAAGLVFDIYAPDVDETPLRGESPARMVKRLARIKAETALQRRPDARIVIAADTTVAIAGRSLGKPRNAAEAQRMLRELSGKTHFVHTGFCVAAARVKSAVVTTRVTFRTLSRADIARYVASGECFDKAGAYAIQGVGAALIARVQGSYTNVIGLPVAEVLACVNDS